MTDIANIPRVILVINGPLEMSEGKIACQTFQACVRLYDARCPEHWDSLGHVARMEKWERYTTTIARIAKTPHIFERVCAEVPGVPMIDEGYTEVPEGSVTCWVSWPLLRHEEPKILKNSKVPLL